MTEADDDEIVGRILDALPEEVALLELDGRIVRVNKAWRDFAAANGAPDGSCDPGADYLAACDAATGEDAAVAQAAAEGIRAVLRSEIEQFVTEYPCHSPAFEGWFQLSVTPYADRGAVGAVVTHTDITARRAIEDALRASEVALERLNRVHAVLSGINTLILHVRDRADLFRQACRVAVEDGGFCMALILVATADEGVLRPAASFGVDDAYQRAVAEILTSSRAAATMGLQALSGGRAIFSNDVLNDPTLLLRDDYHARGVRSMAALPLVVDGRPLGLFLLYAVEQGFFQDAEVALLAQLGDNIAFAVDHIEKIERIAYLARFDEGTGLANRSLFIERVAGRLAAARLADASNCLMVFDLERFKSINDIFGRDAGDSLLRQVAAWLMARIGDEARIARVGPDQFAVVTREFPPGDDFMAHLDADLIAFLAHPFRFNEAVFRLDMKAGLVVAPDDGQDAEVLLNHAEVALKQAKRTGTQRVVYDRQMSKNLAYRLALEGQMREAVEKNQFVLHYQPKISLTTGKLTGSEALIRWNDPRDGLTPPGRFIRTLEETGLIQQVGRWVLHTAIDDHTRWRAAGLAPGRVAVNVSPLQLRDRDFAVKVERLVGASSGLELEITESMIAEDIGNTADSLKRLRNNAVTIAIDDFGTGYSSLSHLAKLPVDTLKIDQTFIADMTLGPNELSLVSTIINLGHSLKLTVVAEGVESGEQARLLRLLGCDEMQGFLISAAVPPDEFASMYLRPAVAGSTA